MSARIWPVMLVATLAIFARVAGAEMRLDVNEELQRAEEFRKDQEQRRQQASVSQMKILIDPDQDDVSRLILDAHDQDAFRAISSLTVGEFREWLLRAVAGDPKARRYEKGTRDDAACYSCPHAVRPHRARHRRARMISAHAP